MNEVWLGIGANIGNRISFLETAVSELGDFLTEIRVSPVYETAPRDFFDQPDFLNAVVKGYTSLSPVDVLERIHLIENNCGRIRPDTAVKGPRTIDIDILIYGGINETFPVGNGQTLTIPHKAMSERLFVLRPLLDIDPDKTDPRDNILFSIKASHLSDQRVKLYRK